VRRFARLYARLDATTSTNDKVAALRSYFAEVEDTDAAWATWFLIGQRIRRLMPHARLREWATAATGLPAWLVEDAYAAVGDQAETVALLLDAHGAPHARERLDRLRATGDEDARWQPPGPEASLATWIERFVLPLQRLDDEARRTRLETVWMAMLERRAEPSADTASPGVPARDPLGELFVLHKLLTGALRVGVSRGLVERAIAEFAELPRPVVAHRLMGSRNRPDASTWRRLIAADDGDADAARPYPFFLATPLEQGPHALGDPASWRAEWKWDGIRAQLVRRAGDVWLWSRGEELITERFPEITAPALADLPDGTVLDGEVLAWDADGDDAVPGIGGRPLPFAVLQTRIGRKEPSAKARATAPVRFLAYDLLEQAGRDRRGEPQDARRARLETLLQHADSALGISPLERFSDWQTLSELRATSRARGTEGLMLKRGDGVYGTGRQRGAWFKWKIAPLTLDVVLLYAQAGHGRRSNLHTDYTLAVWSGDELVPIAKAYSGLDDAELRRLDRWIRQNTLERFGPVRVVPPEHVFELAFENVAPSKRHKSGLALRFPRIARWRQDKRPEDADTLASAHALLRVARGEEPPTEETGNDDPAAHGSPPAASSTPLPPTAQEPATGTPNAPTTPDEDGDA
jgi:DNA ligase-1